MATEGSTVILTGGSQSEEFLTVNQPGVTTQIVLNQGFGQDTVVVLSPYSLKFGEGIRPEDVQLQWNGYHSEYISYVPSGGKGGYTLQDHSWQISIRGTSDVLILKTPLSAPVGPLGQYSYSGESLDHVDGLIQLEFADGTVWTEEQVTRELRKTENSLYDVYGTQGADLIVGNGDRHGLRGFYGNDTLIAGLGIEVLDGGSGKDLYRFDSSWGGDTVIADSEDTLQFTALNRDAVTVSRSPYSIYGDVSIQTLDGAKTMIVRGTQISPDIGAAKVTFSDGSVWSIDELARSAPESLTGTSGVDSLVGGSGQDTLRGMAGNDYLNGMRGADLLDGSAGNDTLSGGLGNDRLIGGKGGDTYLFARGEGQDTIVDADGTWFVTDVLKVGDAKSNQLWLTRSGNNLEISIIGTTDKVTVQDWFVSTANRVEKITALGDGKTLSHTKVNALVTAMAAFAPPAEGQTTLPTDVQASLNKVLASSWA